MGKRTFMSVGGLPTVRRTHFLASSVAGCLLVASVTTSHAEEVEKKLRLAFSLSGFSANDQSHSASANRRVLFEPNGEFSDIMYDPRNDSGALSDFGIEPEYGGVFSVSYAFSRLWYLEGSVGYRQGPIGNVEVQAQFQGAPVPQTQDFLFTIFNLDGGTLKQIPVQATAGVRFRPKAAFNPFICFGIGYALNSYEPSDEINALSRNLDQSTGAFAQLGGGLVGGESLAPVGPSTNLTGVTVDAPDAAEWHAGGGFEYSFHSKWVFFLDARYTVYTGKFAMRINGSDELGISVPADRAFTTDPGAFGPFGAYSIDQGGLIDGGSYVPIPQAPPDTDCVTSHVNCQFTGPRDGVRDPGFYYVHAGEVRYDGLQIQLGVKFTF